MENSRTTNSNKLDSNKTSAQDSQTTNNNGNNSNKDSMDQRSTRSRKASLQNLAQKNKAHRAKIQNSGKASAPPLVDASSVEPCTSVGVKRKTSDLGEERSKRQRQAPVCHSTPLPSTSTATAPRICIYKSQEYLAIRNPNNSFYLCRAVRNIYKNGRKVSVMWYSNENSPSGKYTA